MPPPPPFFNSLAPVDKINSSSTLLGFFADPVGEAAAVSHATKPNRTLRFSRAAALIHNGRDGRARASDSKGWAWPSLLVCAGRTLLKSDISVAPTSAAHTLFA